MRDPVLLEPDLRRLAAAKRGRLHAAGETDADELSIRGGLGADLIDGEVYIHDLAAQAFSNNDRRPRVGVTTACG